MLGVFESWRGSHTKNLVISRFIVRADEKLIAFLELERQVLTMTFYLESIQ